MQLTYMSAFVLTGNFLPSEGTCVYNVLLSESTGPQLFGVYFLFGPTIDLHQGLVTAIHL